MLWEAQRISGVALIAEHEYGNNEKMLCVWNFLVSNTYAINVSIRVGNEPGQN